MISILIPVYNYDVTELVTELALQCEKNQITYEIICVNDASESTPIDFENENIHWHTNSSNLGRARTRNFLATMAKYKELIFLDADVMPSSPDFIKNYIENNHHSVVCGGISYSSTQPSTDKLLRWNYGLKNEMSNAHTRNKNPFLSFMTGNFMCSKSVFEKVTFNASLTSYGHEDTLFGKELLENAYEIKHIDNSAIHLGLETNSDFLEKTKEGVRTLALLYREQKLTRHYSKLIKLYENLELTGLKKLALNILSRKSAKFENDLVKKGSNIWKLQLLKILWFNEQVSS